MKYGKQSNADRPLSAPGDRAKNPAGRPKGSRSMVALACEEYAKNNSREVLLKLFEMAKKGEFQAIKLIMDRVWPLTRGVHLLGVELPKVRCVEDLEAAHIFALQMFGEGKMCTDQLNSYTNALEKFRLSHETTSLTKRVDALCEVEIVNGE